MTKAARQKAERQATADNVASQPLFDAIRIGFEKTNDQRAELSIARDIVQYLNVESADESNTNQEHNYRRSINCAVKAWTSATNIYANIFQALAEVTSEHSSRSKDDALTHAKFVEIAKTANEAKKAVQNFKLFQMQSTTGIQESLGNAENTMSDVADEKSSSSASDDDEDKEPVDSTPTNETLRHLLGQGPRPQPINNKEGRPLLQRSSRKIKYDSKGGKILWQKGVEKPSVPFGTLGGSQKKEWRAEKRRQNREKKAATRATKQVKSQANEATTRERAAGFGEDTSRPIYEQDYISLSGTADSRPHAVSTEYVVPKVEYEDVSAEVEARLKAKEVKKKAAKEEKKRKRESGDSFLGEINGKAGNPKKKKTKADEAVEDVGLAAQKHGRDDVETIEDEARKKRKKAKS